MMNDGYGIEIVYDKGQKDFFFRAGHFQNGLLNGPGRESERVSDPNGLFGIRMTTRIGMYKDGLLDGVGIVNVDNEETFGFFEKGVMSPLEEWTSRYPNPSQVNYKDQQNGDVNPCLYYGESDESKKATHGVFLCHEVSRELAYYFDKDEATKSFFFIRKFNSVVSYNFFGDVPDDMKSPLEYVYYNFRASKVKDVKAKQGTKILPKGFCRSNESLRIHFPASLEKIEPSAVFSRDRFYEIKLEVFFEGTMEQWRAIEKGEDYYETVEDWYGYYYHNSSRYDTVKKHKPWFFGVENGKVIVHCQDGDLTDHG